MDKKKRRLIKGIRDSIKKFMLNLSDKIVLTEAATGNYAVTSVISAIAGAQKVFALSRDSRYGSVEEVIKQTYELADEFHVKDKINIVTTIDMVPLDRIDILTNTGFLRPIDRNLISKLSSKCVIPLMYEPWEFRQGEIDLEACHEKGIKVYGTNESDERLKTFEYIGFGVLYFLLEEGITPFNSRILLIGCKKFVYPVLKILLQNQYKVEPVTEYETSIERVSQYSAIVILEHERDILVVGERNKAYITKEDIGEDTLVIHVSGNVDFKDADFKYVPEEIKPFGYMSIRADFIDPQAVIDLHTAGLKVAEGMLKANELGLKGEDYKKFMEENYPALAFEDSRFW